MSVHAAEAGAAFAVMATAAPDAAHARAVNVATSRDVAVAGVWRMAGPFLRGTFGPGPSGGEMIDLGRAPGHAHPAKEAAVLGSRG
jgi:hypothetical protein